MKISQQALDSITTKGSSKMILPLVPEKVKYKKEQMMSFRLRTDPAVDTSPTYDLYVPFVTGTEDLRACISFIQNIKKVCIGMNVTTAPAKHQMTLRVLKDTALTAYQGGVVASRQQRYTEAQSIAYAAARNAPNNGDEAAGLAAAAPVRLGDFIDIDWGTGLNSLCTYMSPYKVLQRVKTQLRRHTRKPTDMTIREFYNHFTRINTVELAMLPPLFTPAQSLTEDEVLDIFIYATPSSWQREMERQGFDPYLNTILDTINFAERIEAAESKDQGSAPNKSQANKSSSKKKSGYKSGGSAKKPENSDGFSCLHHGPNGTHDTDDCIFLKNQSKRAKTDRSSSGNDYGSKNKVWSREATDNRNKNKKDLAAFMRKTIRKELHAISKKRKSDDDEESLNNVESDNESFGDIDLGELNYADMADLKIDDDESEIDLDLSDGEVMN